MPLTCGCCCFVSLFRESETVISWVHMWWLLVWRTWHAVGKGGDGHVLVQGSGFSLISVAWPGQIHLWLQVRVRCALWLTSGGVQIFKTTWIAFFLSTVFNFLGCFYLFSTCCLLPSHWYCERCDGKCLWGSQDRSTCSWQKKKKISNRGGARMFSQGRSKQIWGGKPDKASRMMLGVGSGWMNRSSLVHERRRESLPIGVECAKAQTHDTISMLNFISSSVTFITLVS